MSQLKMTPELAQALFNLRTNDDFMVFMNAVGDLGEEINTGLLKNPNHPNRDYSCGAGGIIVEMIEALEKAPDDLEAFKNLT